MRNVLLSVLGLMILGGCATQTDDASAPAAETTDTSNDEIIGGTPTTGDPAIVALYGTKEGQEGGSLCTATLITPTVLLTAAHCVSPETVGEGVTFRALLGANLTDATTPSPSIPVSEVHFDPEFSAQNLPNGHDIAVAILAQPHTATPIPWNKKPLSQSLVGTKVRAVGYGLNDGFGQKGAGIKRQSQLKLNKFDTKLVSTGGFLNTICSGDSGGPILANVDGKETVIAVNSYGLIFCLAASSSTRVDTYKSFVEQYL